MAGWIVSLTYESNAGRPVLEALFASWQADRDQAIRAVAAFDPLGSRVVPQVVTSLTESMLRGLNLSPGETGRLRAGRG